MKNKILLAAALIIAFVQTNFAQEGENLIKNPSFESLSEPADQIRKLGRIDVSEHWLSATEAPADLFVTGARGDKANVPNNNYGKQKPADGDHYGGFVAYSRERRTTRSYLQVKFSTPLEANKQYCVKFKVSLGDLSKYAVNGIGASVVQKKESRSGTAELQLERHAEVMGNKVIEDMTQWTTLCGTYLAKGGETHLVIGCFDRDDQLEIERMRRPSDLTEPQEYLAYYYVDEVSLNKIQAQSQCQCGHKSLKPDIIYSRSVNFTDDMTAAEKLSASSAYFGSNTADLNAVAKRDLKKVVDILEKNPSLKIAVVGHMDDNEFNEAKLNEKYKDLALKRAQNVVDFLVDEGLSRSRFGTLNKENKEPANTRPTPMSIAQNRRVEFVVQ
jgi:outer membrane protein OmpA-like peptidoglycan-associated protein